MSIFVRSTYYEIKKVVCGAGFWMAIAIALILMLTYGIYEDGTGKSYNIITVISQIDYQKYQEMELTRPYIFYNIEHSSLMMYSAAVAALCFTGSICQEKRNNVKRYTIYRTGKLTDTLSKASAAFITSGAVFVAASLVCLAVICIFFPDAADKEMCILRFFTNKDGSTTGLYNMFGFNIFYILQLAGQFIYGGVSAAIGFIVVAFSSSIYLSVCLPFFVGYGYVSVCNSILMAFSENKVSLAICNMESKYMDSRIYTVFWRNSTETWWVFASLSIIWIVAIIVYRIRMGVQDDCGGGAL